MLIFFLTASYASSVFQNGKAEFLYKGEPYELVLKPGRYHFEAYGASGGGPPKYETIARDPDHPNQCLPVTKNNTICNITTSQQGAGGYIAGDIIFLFPTKVFIYVGGQGKYSLSPSPGGYNGGGSSHTNKNYDGAGSGGGSTDFRLVEDSLFNRVLVAGAGGGSDNNWGPLGPYADDDGSGGSGGYPGQGMWINGTYQPHYEVDTLSGYMFGRGQDAYTTLSEGAGAGSGFFGGYSYDSNNAGGGGGSSFAFSDVMPVPTEDITWTDPENNNEVRKKYAFLDFPQYKMFNVVHETGVHIGDGLAIITIIETLKIKTCSQTKSSPVFSFSIIIALKSSSFE